ncbi:MAG: hypothetical protein A2651_01645 [Candidatus Yanofskybacteria bacterium RIFCSPHIGHO2_01_FULL_42_12]|nr:MAG: hypothetical protein A2651_01645 [Candidatus Yanofskybacteria bacterium RIFCSPHIGHO2_01_FULL_42_12]
MKKFSFPLNMVRADVFNRFFGSFYRRGGAARGGGSFLPPLAAAKWVRTIFSILHQLGNVKHASPAKAGSATKLYGTLGSKTNSRFRLGKENFFITLLSLLLTI